MKIEQIAETICSAGILIYFIGDTKKREKGRSMKSHQNTNKLAFDNVIIDSNDDCLVIVRDDKDVVIEKIRVSKNQDLAEETDIIAIRDFKDNQMILFEMVEKDTKNNVGFFRRIELKRDILGEKKPKYYIGCRGADPQDFFNALVDILASSIDNGFLSDWFDDRVEASKDFITKTLNYLKKKGENSEEIVVMGHSRGTTMAMLSLFNLQNTTKKPSTKMIPKSAKLLAHVPLRHKLVLIEPFPFLPPLVSKQIDSCKMQDNADTTTIMSVGKPPFTEKIPDYVHNLCGRIIKPLPKFSQHLYQIDISSHSIRQIITELHERGSDIIHRIPHKAADKTIRIGEGIPRMSRL